MYPSWATTATDARCPRSRRVKEQLQGAITKRLAKVGANGSLLRGVVIGENALVSAGVVVADFPIDTVVVRNGRAGD